VHTAYIVQDAPLDMPVVVALRPLSCLPFYSSLLPFQDYFLDTRDYAPGIFQGAFDKEPASVRFSVLHWFYHASFDHA